MTNKIAISVKKLANSSGIDLPKYETASSAGMDLCAAIEDNIVLSAGERCLVPAGFSIALPVGYEAQVRPRSGLALKHGVTVLNTPGTIDADYRGEIKIILVNLGQEDFEISRGMRIAQMIIAPVTQARFLSVENLDETERGEGGFGSTGTHN